MQGSVARLTFAAASLLLALCCGARWLSPAHAQDEVDWNGCLSGTAAVVARVSVERIRFCGRITETSVDALRAELTIDDRTLEITSLGGELDAPVRLGEIVLDRRLAVEVIGPCLSGCASYVFVAGASRRVRQNAWFGLHNTSSSAEFVALRANGAELAPRDAPLRARAARERMLYRAKAVSERLLLDPQARIGTECIRPAGRNGITRETEYDIVSRQSLWVPTRAQWRAYGVEAEGYFPRNAWEARRVARATLPRRAGDVVRIAFSAAPLPAPAADMLASVGWCD